MKNHPIQVVTWNTVMAIYKWGHETMQISYYHWLLKFKKDIKHVCPSIYNQTCSLSLHVIIKKSLSKPWSCKFENNYSTKSSYNLDNGQWAILVIGNNKIVRGLMGKHQKVRWIGILWWALTFYRQVRYTPHQRIEVPLLALLIASAHHDPT